jgi:hypothetical protein
VSSFISPHHWFVDAFNGNTGTLDNVIVGDCLRIGDCLGIH